MPPPADDPARFTHPGGAAEPARAAELSLPAQNLLTDAQSPEQLLAALARGGLSEDGVKFFARVLPKREAVWWAARCAATVPRPPAEVTPAAHEAAVAAEAAARAAAEAWCGGPADDRRRACFPAGQAAADSPSGLAALAAFFADGSMGPADIPAVPPPADACAAACAAAVLLAAVRVEPDKADAKRKRFLETGKAVLAGTDRWPDAPPPPSPVAVELPAAAAPPPPPKRRTGYY